MNRGINKGRGKVGTQILTLNPKFLLTPKDKLMGVYYNVLKKLVMLSGFILGMGSANERRRYIVTSSLIGWAHTQKEPYCVVWDALGRRPAVLSILRHGDASQWTGSSLILVMACRLFGTKLLPDQIQVYCQLGCQEIQVKIGKLSFGKMYFCKWKINHINYKVWGETAYPFWKPNGAVFEICEWRNIFVSHFTRHVTSVITYPS